MALIGILSSIVSLNGSILVSVRMMSFSTIGIGSICYIVTAQAIKAIRKILLNMMVLNYISKATI